jgi:hypothetical protein
MRQPPKLNRLSTEGIPDVKYYTEQQEYSLFLGLMKSGRNGSMWNSDVQTKISSNAHQSNNLNTELEPSLLASSVTEN